MERERANPEAPVILGLAGGIASGKSTVAREFERLGWVVIDADAEIASLFALPKVKSALVEWWGPAVLDSAGEVDRGFISRLVFDRPSERQRLESLLHPMLPRTRAEIIQWASQRAGRTPPGVVYDAPLLFEAGLDRECDAVVFVEAPQAVRHQRAMTSRGWDADELARREAAQWPIEQKKARCRFHINNLADRTDLPETCRRIASILLGDRGASRAMPG